MHGGDKALAEGNGQQILSSLGVSRVLTNGPLQVQFELVPIHLSVFIHVNRFQSTLRFIASIAAKVWGQEAIVESIELQRIILLVLFPKIPFIPHLPNFSDQMLRVGFFELILGDEI